MNARKFSEVLKRGMEFCVVLFISLKNKKVFEPF
jgi:hypothetical protein